MKPYSPLLETNFRFLAVISMIVIFAALIMGDVLFHYVEAYDQKRAKEIFLGDMQTDIPESMRLSVLTFSLEDQMINTTLKAKVGNQKLVLTGEGVIDVSYKDGDRQCKTVLGAQNLYSEDGQGFQMRFYGKACHMGQNFNIFSGKFFGSEARGIFADKIIEGTISGKMNYGETVLDLKLKSILLYDV